MTYQEAIEHYGADYKALAVALELPPTTVHSWKDRGIPLARQYQIQVISRGRLRADGQERTAGAA